MCRAPCILLLLCRTAALRHIVPRHHAAYVERTRSSAQRDDATARTREVQSPGCPLLPKFGADRAPFCVGVSLVGASVAKESAAVAASSQSSTDSRSTDVESREQEDAAVALSTLMMGRSFSNENQQVGTAAS